MIGMDSERRRISELHAALDGDNNFCEDGFSIK